MSLWSGAVIVMVTLQLQFMNLSLAIDGFENKVSSIDMWLFFILLCDYMRAEGRKLAISSHYIFPDKKCSQCRIINTQMIVFIVLLLCYLHPIGSCKKRNEYSAA